MKFTFPILALFATAITAAALPDEDGMVLRRADEVNMEGLNLGDLEVKDERFGDMIFRGTAKSIYEEMKSLKPELFTEEIEETPEENSLVERQAINCNWYDKVNSWGDCSEGLRYLRSLGQSRCGANAGTCARVSCSWNCGMWLCNKRTTHHWVLCEDIATDIAAINANCDRRGRRDFSTHYIGLRWDAC